MSIPTTNYNTSNPSSSTTSLPVENDVKEKDTSSSKFQYKMNNGGIVSQSYVDDDDLTIQNPTTSEEEPTETQMVEQIGMVIIDNFLGWERIGDDTIRNLMKDIIKAFAALLTNQKEADKNALNEMLSAFDEKIKQMENGMDAAYKAAMAGAICSMVAGAVSIVCGIAGLKGISNAGADEAAKKAAAAAAEMINSIGGAIGKIIEGCGGIMSAVWNKDKEGANIDVARQERLVEVFNSMRDENKKFSENLMQFINNILSEMQQLLNAVASSGRSIAQA
ncbi:MAG: hypothetical protein MJ218_00285 [Opitutales bacterium]|nr:hypothetical protein [Opitutales bacterium]